LRCPAGHPLYAQERRPERDGSLRVLYAARIGHCRSCPLRGRCQEKGAATIKPRRKSRVLWPIKGPPPEPAIPPALPPASHAILWGDWSHCQTRREWMTLLRTQTVTITFIPATPFAETTQRLPLTRRQRAHWRQSPGRAISNIDQRHDTDTVAKLTVAQPISTPGVSLNIHNSQRLLLFRASCERQQVRRQIKTGDLRSPSCQFTRHPALPAGQITNAFPSTSPTSANRFGRITSDTVHSCQARSRSCGGRHFRPLPMMFIALLIALS